MHDKKKETIILGHTMKKKRQYHLRIPTSAEFKVRNVHTGLSELSPVLKKARRPTNYPGLGGGGEADHATLSLFCKNPRKSFYELYQICRIKRWKSNVADRVRLNVDNITDTQGCRRWGCDTCPGTTSTFIAADVEVVIAYQATTLTFKVHTKRRREIEN